MEKVTTIRIKVESGKLRSLYRFTMNMLSDVVYDMERDRYVLGGGTGARSIDREFYNTLCEVTEALSAKLAAHQPAITI